MAKSNIVRVTIGAESINAKGYYFDSRDNHYCLMLQFKSEVTMKEHFQWMRESGSDFQMVIERKV